VRKILVVGTLLLVIFIAVYRQRIFLRDPLGKVERDGIAQQGTRLYINYSNDVLVEDASGVHRYLVEAWSGIPGVPEHMFCLTGLMCWTDANEATVLPLGGAGNQTKAVMTAKEVTFRDETGATIRVQLR
jgi:hypothetical protein